MGRQRILIIIRVNYQKCLLLIGCFIILFVLLLWGGYRLTHPVSGTFRKVTVVVDPGHGGIDGGANKDGVLEKDINLQVGLKLRESLEERGLRVVMTRETDVSMESKSNLNASRYRRDLHGRKTVIDQEADLFVSLHVNSFTKNPKAKGIYVFHYEGATKSQALATAIQQGLASVLEEKYPGEGIRVRVESGDYYLLRESAAQGVIVEMGFITNPEERARLQEATYQETLAKAIADGIIDYLTP